MSKTPPHFFITLLLTLTSCSSYQRPESIEDKMARFTRKGRNLNLVPDFPILKQNNYSHVTHIKKSKNSNWDKSTPQKSNRRLYFLALLGQYNHLKNYSSSDSAPILRSCPSFHTSMLTFQKNYRKKNKRLPFAVANKLPSKDILQTRPEYHLPVTADSIHPKVIDIISKSKKKSIKEVVKNAIDLHINKTYNELKELCEYGHSDNYYSYENLGHYFEKFEKKEKVLSPNAEVIGVLFKTTLYSNMALLSSLKMSVKRQNSRSPASINPQAADNLGSTYTNAVSKRLGIEWATSFFNNLYK